MKMLLGKREAEVKTKPIAVRDLGEAQRWLKRKADEAKAEELAEGEFE